MLGVRKVVRYTRASAPCVKRVRDEGWKGEGGVCCGSEEVVVAEVSIGGCCSILNYVARFLSS